MFFSIVIPLYNKAEYVAKTIESVLSQTYKNFEVLIIDDGSTDGSLEVVGRYIDDRIRIVQQKNAGVSAARNTGIKAAQYELIALLDADDWWDKSYLEEMSGLISQYPDVSIYSSQNATVRNAIIFPAKKILNSIDSIGCFDAIEMGIKLNYLPIHSSSVIFKKDILQASGLFDERIAYFEDYDFFLRIGIYSKLAYIEKKPLCYYNHDIDLSKRAVGNLPPINKHFLFYLDKFESLFNKSVVLKPFLQQFALNNLFLFRQDKNYATIKKKILSQIEIKQFSLKHIIYYYFPEPVLQLILDVHKTTKNIY
ncbi:MAG: glycosyltransferase [Bacteroidales bacterium]|jgi:glycosyltransferase involved in cell wall biosynthesis|nr:glycosyltransferase [Bacteroidales bacterium]